MEKAGETGEEGGVVNLTFEISSQGPAHTWAQTPFPEIWWSKNWASARH